MQIFLDKNQYFLNKCDNYIILKRNYINHRYSIFFMR